MVRKLFFIAPIIWVPVSSWASWGLTRCGRYAYHASIMHLGTFLRLLKGSGTYILGAISNYFRTVISKHPVQNFGHFIYQHVGGKMYSVLLHCDTEIWIRVLSAIAKHFSHVFRKAVENCQQFRVSFHAWEIKGFQILLDSSCIIKIWVFRTPDSIGTWNLD